MENIKNMDKLSYNQAILLLVLYRTVVGLTHLPAVDILPGNQDVWITLLLSIPYTVAFCFPLLYLTNKFNNLNLIEFTEKIMGKVLGKILGGLFTLFLFLSIILFLIVFIEIIDTVLFPEIPAWVTTALMLITSTYIAYKGLNNIGRLGEFIIPLVIISIFIFIILGYGDYDFNELLPILKDSTFKEINIGAMDISLRFFNIIILSMITPHLSQKEYINRLFFRSLIYAIFIVILIVIAVQTTLGTEFSKHINFPFLTFTRLIRIGLELEGFDVLYIPSWIMGNIIKIGGYIYFTTVALGQVTGKKNQIYIIPISIISFFIVLLIKDNRPMLAVKQPMQNIVSIVAAIAIIGLPLILLIVYFFRRKKLSNINDS